MRWAAWRSLFLHVENNKVPSFGKSVRCQFRGTLANTQTFAASQRYNKCHSGYCVHPPSVDDPSMIHYLYESLTSIKSQFPNSGTILLGDFNKLKVSRIKNAFNLKQMIKFPTRGGNILDLVLTDLDRFYDNPRKLPPFGLLDHDTIMVQPRVRLHVPKVRLHTKSRDLRPTKRLAFRQYLEEVKTKSCVTTKSKL